MNCCPAQASSSTLTGLELEATCQPQPTPHREATIMERYSTLLSVDFISAFYRVVFSVNDYDYSVSS